MKNESKKVSMYKAVRMKTIEIIDDYKIKVTFVDRVTGIIDMTKFIFDGAFKAFKNPGKFKKAYINSSGTLAWSKDTDLANDRIYYDIRTKGGICKLK